MDFLILFFYCRPLGERNLSKSLDVISLGSIEREKIINIRSCKSFFVLPHITASQPKLSSSFRQLLHGVSMILYKLQCCFGGEGGLKLNKRNKSGNFYCNRTIYSMSTKDWGITEEAVARVNAIPYKCNVVDCVSGFLWFALKFSQAFVFASFFTMKARREFFLSFIKLLFSLLDNEKDDIRSAYVF